MTPTDAPEIQHVDPRQTLAKWANENDEWVRRIVRLVLSSGKPLGTDDLDEIYSLFRQEKLLDKRKLEPEPRLEISESTDSPEEPLTITRMSEVVGVNAIMPGSVIEPHAGLTILYGENGTGKTGYSRIFKALADSRTADVILGDVDGDGDGKMSAKVEYSIGVVPGEFTWTGERGKAPFTRMSIFDSRAVNIHVDEDIEYVYTPAVLSLFSHLIDGLRAVQERMDTDVRELTSGTSSLLARFPRESTVYPLVETLGAASDLEALRAMASSDLEVEKKIDALRTSVAALEANTFALQISARQSAERALVEALAATTALTEFDREDYASLLKRRAQLAADYAGFRSTLFATADLPAEPEVHWENFIRAGDEYKSHLESLDVHNTDRCLYCRQPLSELASELIKKYGDYLADKISQDLNEVNKQLALHAATISKINLASISGFIAEYNEREDKPSYLPNLVSFFSLASKTKELVAELQDVVADTSKESAPLTVAVTKALASIRADLVSLQEQSDNRVTALVERRKELVELTGSAELAKSWPQIEAQVKDAKEAYRLKALSQAVPTLRTAVTSLSKTASKDLINNSFEELFLEECKSLRARELKLQFVGRDGKPQRRKMIGGKHKPSKVFSEGEQKVLAIADFLAEARLAGIAAPVIFDDPVSSLDYRRINEVAERIAVLSADTQIIVFTHDIFFAAKLLALFETSKKCVYYQVTDEVGMGQVTRATGPRSDSLSYFKGRINDTIQKANAETGEARAALVQTGYSLLRSWCEVFTETVVLQGVTQRYQPQVRMTVLAKIKIDRLESTFTTVTEIFEEACRYIDGHSQPLASLSVAPTVPGLEAHWKTLIDCQKAYEQK